jgi:hypothetical protein
MVDAVIYVDNGEDLSTCENVSSALNFLGMALKERELTLGEVRKDDKTLCAIRLLPDGSFVIQAFDVQAMNNLTVDLNAPTKILGISTTTQSIGTNMNIGGSVTFGNIVQNDTLFRNGKD